MSEPAKGESETPNWSEYAAREVTWPYSLRDETLQPIRYLDGLDEAFVRAWLGGDTTPEDIHHLVGVPVGARVTVRGALRACIAIESIGQAKIINRDGKEVIARYQSLVHVPLSARANSKAAQVLHFHFCTSEPQRSGFGTDAVVRMVAACEKLGLSSIEGLLAGDGHDPTDTSTGYYAWATLGFDAPLSTWVDESERPLPEGLRMLLAGKPLCSLLDLFEVPGGQQWWLENGSTVTGTFEVPSNSRSSERLRFAVEKLARERRLT